MTSPSHPTSPQVPDTGELRLWLERTIAARSFVVLVSAIVALVVRMRDLNLELCRRLAKVQSPRPPSERLKPLKGQLALALGTEVITRATAPDASKPEDKVKPSRAGHHPGRTRAPAHLERVPRPNLVPPQKRICPVCGCEMKTLNFTPCEHLDVIPARIIVVERLDETVACEHDDCIVSAAPPPQLIPRGKLGLTLIIEALADKYLEHLPIERQCLRFERSGVAIAPQTLGRAVAAAIDAFTPIADLILGKTRGPGNLATDATGIPVLDREAPGGIRIGTIWVWTNARWVSFVYAPKGNSESVRGFLGEDLARTVQCDGTSLTTFLERAGGKRPGCWAHGRRRLHAAARCGDLLALEGIELIAPLFRIEREAMLAGDTAEQRKARRAEHSVPALASIQAWVDEHSGAIPPKTPLGKALGYLRRQWKRLQLFVQDGNLEITNNRCERELRKLVLGRKNWLFTWEDLGVSAPRASCRSSRPA
jgi:transposase